MKQKFFVIILFLLYWFAGCTNPTETEPGLILVQTITLEFDSPFETESIILTEGIYYEVKLSGEFNYQIADTNFLSQSGIYTIQFCKGLKPGFRFSFPHGTPFTILSNFTLNNCINKFNPSGIYYFRGTCSKTESIKFSFENPWAGMELKNTSGLVTVEIYKEAE